MQIECLTISLGAKRIGQLFRYGKGSAHPVIRFVADDDFAASRNQPVLSISMLSEDAALQTSFWKNIQAPEFNGSDDGQLPVFFQNALPEGLFRRHVAMLRGCDEKDNFALFAAVGGDLPGALRATPSSLERDEMARLVTQGNDALEMSVTEEPLPFGVSLSGMQPKVGLIGQGGRYVARKRNGSTRIIGKLPQSDRPQLPEVEHLSLSLAAAAGASVCEHKLEPLTKLDFEHGFAIGGSTNFLAVTRFDRVGAKRIHCEDFAQVLGVDPNQKYSGATYAAIAAVMLRFPDSMGINAVHELLRLICINDLIGNFDAHLKNFCVIYLDGITPTLSPAFDIVAYSLYATNHSAPALAMYRDASVDKFHRQFLSPSVLREFCTRLDISEKRCQSVIRDTVEKAVELWPAVVEKSEISNEFKSMLLARIRTHRLANRWLAGSGTRKPQSK